MILDDLTSDNIHLSRPKMPDSCADFTVAIRGRTLVDEHVSSLVRESLADSTRRAYLSDLAHFETWGGQVPATDDLIASYLAAHAETSSTATLQPRVASLSKAHRALGVPNPTQSELVKAVPRGIKRAQRTPVMIPANPSSNEQIEPMTLGRMRRLALGRSQCHVGPATVKRSSTPIIGQAK
jgi:hypothetical protein